MDITNQTASLSEISHSLGLVTIIIIVGIIFVVIIWILTQLKQG